MTPVHITKRALAVVGGRDPENEPRAENACTGGIKGECVAEMFFGQRYYHPPSERRVGEALRRVTCPACLVLLDAEFERGGCDHSEHVECPYCYRKSCHGECGGGA